MRKRFISHWSFQNFFALAMARGAIIAAVIPAGLTLLTLFLMSQHPSVSPDQKRILEYGIKHLIVVTVGIAVVLAILFWVFGIFFSNRFVGPLNRIEAWCIQWLTKKEPEPIKTRKKDEFREIAASLNRIVYQMDPGEENE